MEIIVRVLEIRKQLLIAIDSKSLFSANIFKDFVFI